MKCEYCRKAVPLTLIIRRRASYTAAQLQFGFCAPCAKQYAADQAEWHREPAHGGWEAWPWPASVSGEGITDHHRLEQVRRYAKGKQS